MLIFADCFLHDAEYLVRGRRQSLVDQRSQQLGRGRVAGRHFSRKIGVRKCGRSSAGRDGLFVLINTSQCRSTVKCASWRQTSFPGGGGESELVLDKVLYTPPSGAAETQHLDGEMEQNGWLSEGRFKPSLLAPFINWIWMYYIVTTRHLNNVVLAVSKLWLFQ